LQGKSTAKKMGKAVFSRLMGEEKESIKERGTKGGESSGPGDSEALCDKGAESVGGEKEGEPPREGARKELTETYVLGRASKRGPQK